MNLAQQLRNQALGAHAGPSSHWTAPELLSKAAEAIDALGDALRTAAFDMATEDVFGDNPRITAAINRINDALRKHAPEPTAASCDRCGGNGRINVYQCEGACECGLCPEGDDCPECTSADDH